MVVRPVYDYNSLESYPGQQEMMRGLGKLYADIARIQIRVVHEGSLTAEVMHACEPVLAGDIVVPLTPRSAPAYRQPKLVDRFAPYSGKSTGVVVAAKELDQNVGEGQVVYVNLGTAQGLQVGSYLRVFRTALAKSQDPFEQAAREYMTEAMGGQQVGRRLTRAELASLPRNVLGEIMLISVEEGSSSGIITFSREEITLGDMVEIESPTDVRLTPPTLTCTGNPAQVEAGQPVRLSAMGVSATGTPLTYTWMTNGGTIQGTGPMVTLQTTGLSAGTYVATVQATEGTGLTADCNVTITVRTPRPPTVSCSADRQRVLVGEIVNLTAMANSPDGRPLTYMWSSTGGQVQGTGANVQLDTTNLAPGTHTVRVVVSDDRGLTAECSIQIAVDASPPPPPPQVSKLNECQFAQNSARVDNVCKAKLDDIVLRLQSEPDATLAIVGYAESNETNPAQLAQNRANNTRTYFTQDRGMPAGRFDVRTGTGAVGAEYRRVDLHLVPAGATFTGASLFQPVEVAPVVAKQEQEPASPVAEARREVIAQAR